MDADTLTELHDLTAAYLANMQRLTADHPGIRDAAPSLTPALTTLSHILQRELTATPPEDEPCDDRR